MILPIFNSMKAIPNNLLQASSDLGASPLITFRKVIIPLTKEVMTGIQVTFIPALSLFMITRLIAGNKVINIGTSIEEQFLTIQKLRYGLYNCVILIIFMAFILILTKSKSSNGKGERREMVWKDVHRYFNSNTLYTDIFLDDIFI